MKITLPKRIVKWSGLASIVMLVLISSAQFIACPNSIQEKMIDNQRFENQDLAPRTQDITEEGNFTGVGQPLSTIEYANSTNASQEIGPFNNNEFGLGRINIPPEWTGYKLFTQVFDLKDNRTWQVNGTVDSQYGWTYEEVDDEPTAPGDDQNCWGLYNATPPTGTTTGALFTHHGYIPSDYCDNLEYSAYGQTIYVNRSDISGVRCSFNYWTNSSHQGLSQAFVDINGYRKYFAFFATGTIDHVWLSQEFVIAGEDLTTYFSGPEDVTLKVGVQVMLDNIGIGSGYFWHDIYWDNITVWFQGKARPPQVQLKLNNTAVSNMNYGIGNVTLTGLWTNPSTSDFQALLGSFTTNETGVQLTTSFSIYANRTKQSQTLESAPGSVFWVSNNTGANWTAYYYAYTPYQYTDYNFTLTFPTDWMPWAVFDPTPTSIMSDLVVGSGYIRVDSSKANRPGLWRFEFGATNFVSQLKIYRNSTPGPMNWLEGSEFIAGDYLNVTATVSGATTGTTAQLNLQFPNGTLWSAQSKQATVLAGGITPFSPIQIPSLAGPDYVVGDYTVFVTWNNSVSGSPCNETGMRSGTFSVRHRSKLIPDNPIVENLVQNDLIDIYVSFLDLQSDTAITGGTLWFTNTTEEVQTMTMISPGYYYAETNLTTADLVGEINLSIHGDHTLYTGSIANISLRYSILTSLVSNITELTLPWGDSFTFEVNFSTLFDPYQGISTATITTDWDDGYWTYQYKGNGNYSITGDSTPKSANRLFTLLVSVEAAGFIGKSMAFSVFVLPRQAFLSSVVINDINVTQTKSIDLAVTSTLNFTVKWWDVGSWSLVDSASIQVVGIGSSPFSFTRVGNEYQCQVSGSILNLGVHYITVAAARPNFTDSTMALEIQLHRIQPSFRTADNTNSYSISVENPFILGIYVDNVDFGGTITGCTVEYAWSEGSGVLTEVGGTGYYSTALGNLPEGTWEFIISVYIGPNYEYKEYTVTVSVAPVEGLPPWVLYLTIGALAGVMVGIFSYVFYFRFPPSVRQARALKRNVKKGGTRPVIVKSIDTLLVEDYLNQSQGLLPPTTQTTLRNRYLKEQKATKGTGRDTYSLPKESPVEGKKDMTPGGEPI